MTSNRRGKSRKEINWPASVLVEGHLIECRISDVSESGAKIRIPGDKDLPSEFKIVFSLKGQIWRSCKIIWRDKNETGVQFVGPPHKDLFS
jgi:hypothetical protein